MPTRLPTLGAMAAEAGRTLRRFPLVLLAAVLSAGAAVLTTESLGPEQLQLRLLATASLGLPLFTALTLAGERRGSRAARWALAAGGVVVLATFYAGWAWWSEPVCRARYLQLSAAFHLMVAFLPFARRGESHAFWQFNRVLFERGIVAAIFSSTLWISLALALLALDKLFGVDVPMESYGRMWCLVAFVFNTWFFLGGVPADPAALESRRDYPRLIKVFAQYLLVPIVSAYLVILTAYLAKVIVVRDWPSGWIGWLVSDVAVAGIMALLLIEPAAEEASSGWVTAFARGFWLALLPATAMLWLAIWQRVQQYGITEPRYFLLVLSVWLAAAAVYFGFTRSRELRLIPLSLAVVAVVTFGGPWSAYRVSEASQARRLAGLLERHHLLAGGRIRAAGPAGAAVPVADRREISATLRYLALTHGFGRIAPWLGDSVAPAWLWGSPNEATANQRARSVVRQLGLAYVEEVESPPAQGARHARYLAAHLPAAPLSGFTYLLRVDSAGARADTGYRAVLRDSTRSVEVWRGADRLLAIGLDSAMAAARAWAQGRSVQGRTMGMPLWTVPPALLRAEAEGPAVSAVVLLSWLEVADSAGVMVPSAARGEVLLRLRR